MTDRSQRGRLLLDVGLLAAILIGLVLVAAPGTPYMSDEGNVYLQVEALMAGEWVVPYAFADLDPGFELRHLQRGLISQGGVVPYARHPLHATLLTPLFERFGIAAFNAVAIAGVILAAWLSALLAREVDPRFDRAIFWVVGLASPLAFHAHLWLAHSLATAAVAAGALFTVYALRRNLWWSLAAGVAVAMATGLRSEALLAGPALGVMVGALWLLKTVSFRSALAAAGPLGAFPLGVWLAERSFTDSTFGSSAVSVQIESLNTGVEGVLNAFLITMLYSSYVESLLFWLLAAAPIFLWHVGRRARTTGDTRPLVITSVVVVLLLVIRLIQTDVWPIPGLWVAFPIAVVLLSQLRIKELRPAQLAVPTGAALLIWIGIIATQYSIGGGLEWGARYFSIIIPLLAPAMAAGLGYAASWERGGVMVRLAAVSTMVLLGIQVATMGAIHNSSARFIDDLAATGQQVTDAPRGRPIVLAVDVVTLSYITTSVFSDFDWMIASELDKYSEGLAILDAVGASEAIIIAEPAVPDPPGWELQSSTSSAFNMELRVYSR